MAFGNYKHRTLSKIAQEHSTGGVGSGRVSGQITHVVRPRGGSWTAATVKTKGGSLDCSFQPFSGLSPGINVEFDLVADSRMRTGCKATNVRRKR